MRQDDAAVLAYLRGHGPGGVRVREIREAAGLHSATVRASVLALMVDGLVCVIPGEGENGYLVRHLHAGPGECEEPLGQVIQEVHPDGQR
jgi:predicted DNA-binding transcriptional regulator